MLQISLTAAYLLHLTHSSLPRKTAESFKEGIGQESNGAANQEKQIFLLCQISSSASSTRDLWTRLGHWPDAEFTLPMWQWKINKKKHFTFTYYQFGEDAFCLTVKAVSMRNHSYETHFHMKVLIRGIALKQRYKVTTEICAMHLQMQAWKSQATSLLTRHELRVAFFLL